MTSADRNHGLDATLLLQLFNVLEQLQAQAPDPERGRAVDLLRPLCDQLAHTSDGVDVDIDAAIGEARALLGADTDAFDALLADLRGVEATSLGTTGAQAVRRTSPDAIAAVLARTAALSARPSRFAQQQAAAERPIGRRASTGYGDGKPASESYNQYWPSGQQSGTYGPSFTSPPGASVISAATGGQTLKIDDQGDTPPHEQLRVHYARAISTRQLPIGAKLPTVRALAKDLGLAVNTVARAYRELEEAGLVETRGRAGTVVSATSDSNHDRIRAAAAQYAAMSTELGLTPQEALEIVREALHS